MMPSEVAAPALFALGAVAFMAGAFGAMLGIGGGIILVPVLITVFAVDAEAARAASLVAVCTTSLAGSLVYIREGATDLIGASYLQLPTTVGAIAGALIGRRLDDDAIKLLFALLLLVVGFHLLFTPLRQTPTAVQRSSWAQAGAACLGGGIISSLLGVGGGLVFVPVLSLLLAREPRQAAATSTYLIGLTAAASGLIYAKAGHVNVDVTIAAAFGVLLGAQAGARVSRFVPGLWLRRAFAVVMWVNAAALIVKVGQGG